jgi:hypothetical protein
MSVRVAPERKVINDDVGLVVSVAYTKPPDVLASESDAWKLVRVIPTCSYR